MQKISKVMNAVVAEMSSSVWLLMQTDKKYIPANFSGKLSVPTNANAERSKIVDVPRTNEIYVRI